MTITIPPEALEALAPYFCARLCETPCNACRADARAAALALLENWPGMKHSRLFPGEWYIILPLPTETDNG